MSNRALESVLAKLEHVLTPDLTTNELAEKRTKGEYEYIPLMLPAFMDQMLVVSRMFERNNPSFIDVGCGIGVKLLLAREFLGLSKITGIEIHPKYATVAERLAKHHYAADTNMSVIKADAIKHSYKPYDIIYFYRPLSEPSKQEALENQILKTAESGTIIMANGRSMGNNKWASHTQHVWGNVIFKRS